MLGSVFCAHSQLWLGRHPSTPIGPRITGVNYVRLRAAVNFSATLGSVLMTRPNSMEL